MRKLSLLVTLVAMALPAFAARRIPVAQLEQSVAEFHFQPDAKAAGELSELELTERLSSNRLARLESSLPGEKSRQALRLLADSSAFLDPPATDIPSTPAPDLAALKSILTLTVNYVSKTVHQLPNFSAKRVISSFEDTPAEGKPGWDDSTSYVSMHPVGTFTSTVIYRDGREVVDAGAEKGKNRRPGMRTLSTAGVFGPILATVLVDAARSKLAWSRWETGTAGPVAVFSYAVPIEKSHYRLNYGCNGDGSSSCSDRDPSSGVLVAYHGEIAVDPASGAILRLLLEADLRPEGFAVKSGIVVEYGPVEIAGKPYFCPTRSVALTVEHAVPLAALSPDAALHPPLKTSLNDVAFTGYHIFRGDARILTEAEATRDEGTPALQQAGNAAQSSASVPAAGPASLPAPAPVAESSAHNPAPPATQPSVAATVPTDSTAPPPINSQTAAEQESLLRGSPVFKTNARAVVVDVVVTKSNGDPALGLSRQDFEVKEDGKEQAIDFFEEHSMPALPAQASQPLPQLPPNTYSNIPPAPPGDSVNVLLIDTLNTPQQDQAYVHSEIANFLKKMQPGARVAIFALGSKLRYIQGFTTDTSELLAALKSASSVKLVGTRDRGDQAEDAADLARLTRMQSFGVPALAAAQADMSSIDFASRAAMTFEALNHLAAYLEGVPGRKNLIWFSSSFPVIIFPNAAQQKSIENSPSGHDYLNQAKRTADMLTVSKVAVYPVGAEGVAAEHIMEADTAGPASPEGGGHIGSSPDGAMSNGTMSPFVAGAAGRGDAATSMQQLAASTGGKAYINTNDLNDALKRAINDGSHYYTLSYSPADATMDGKYRSIDVRVRKGRYTVAYRHGYNADPPPAFHAAAGSDPLQPLMKLGLPSATGLLYGVRVVPASPQPPPGAPKAGENQKLAAPLTRFSVDFFIRWTDVALQPGPQGEHNGRIEIGLLACDRDGKPVNWDRVTQSMNLDPDAFSQVQKSGIPAHMEIDLPPDAAYLLTGIFDTGGGRVGTLEIPLQPAPPAGR